MRGVEVGFEGGSHLSGQNYKIEVLPQHLEAGGTSKLDLELDLGFLGIFSFSVKAVEACRDYVPVRSGANYVPPIHTISHV